LQNVIQFINKSQFVQDYLPERADKALPEWYKEMSSYVREDDKQQKKFLNKSSGLIETNATIKKCIPVFDSMSAGYILPIADNIEVFKQKDLETGENNTKFTWTHKAGIAVHSLDQVNGYPHNKIHKVNLPKFINNWIIKTVPGYSCLFLPPMHRDSKFSILPAIVDTDTFNHAINLPFTLTDPDFEGTIEAGTPMVQVIPFKRDTFAHEIYDGYDYVQKYPETELFQEEYPESYKNNEWHKKSYK
jgi:hypothetical protein